jgi:hypothetical protein
MPSGVPLSIAAVQDSGRKTQIRFRSGQRESELRKEKAGQERRKLLKIPHHPVANFGIGEVDYARRRYSDAVAHYQLSGELYLKDAEATLRFSQSWLRNWRPDDAVSAPERMAPRAGPRTHFESGMLLASGKALDTFQLDNQ